MKSVYRFLTVIFLSLLTLPLIADDEISWSCGPYTIDIVDKKFILSENKIKLLTISSFQYNFTSPKSIFVSSHSKKNLVLTLTYPSSVYYREEGLDLNTILVITISDHTIHFSGNPKWATNCTIQLEDNGEHYFGIMEPLFPDNKKSADLRGEVVDVEVNGDASLFFENYASVWSAFYMTNKGYASFFDSFARGRYSLGIQGKTELFHRTGKLDWYIFTGKTGDEIMKAYYTVIGRPKSVPLWGCGPIGWRDENKYGKDEVLDDIQKMTDLKIPFTAWFVDCPYSDGAKEWSKMNFNDRFTNPQEWISTIRNTYGMEFMTWVAPLTFEDQDFPKYQFNREGYFDLSDPDVRKEFGRRLNLLQYSVGVHGHKMDRGDQQYPLNIPWYDSTSESEQRNTYALLYSTTIDSILRDAWGTNQMNFARTAYHRCQPYLSAVWGGDSRSTWDGLAASLVNGLRCSFMGFPVWGSDVGGYLKGKIPQNLYARWIQLGAWSGLYEIKLDDANGKGEDRVPWKYSTRLQSIFRDFNNLRMDMQPFYFSLANTSYKNGVIMKPLAYVYPDDKKTYTIWNEYMVGKTFLVAPITDSINIKSVYLPQGTWYDFYDISRSFDGNSKVDATYPLELIPVFIKSNSIYVTGTIIAGNSKLWNVKKSSQELKIHAFPGNEKEIAYFDYVDAADANKEKQLALAQRNGAVLFSAPPLATDAVIIIKLKEKPSFVRLNGASCKFIWSRSQSTITVQLQKYSKNKLEVQL